MFSSANFPPFPHTVRIVDDTPVSISPQVARASAHGKKNPIMSQLRSTSLIVRNVGDAVEFFQSVTGLQVLEQFEHFAELEGRRFRIKLIAASAPELNPATGIILHFEEQDIAAAIQRAVVYGAMVIREPSATEWGTESAWIQGPEGVVIDFYRNA